MTGGFPYAIAAEYEGGAIPERIYRLYRDAIRGEIARAGLNEHYFREVFPGQDISGWARNSPGPR